MQNHYEITSKSQLWTRNVRNWTKSRHLVMSMSTKSSNWRQPNQFLKSISYCWLHKLRNTQGKTFRKKIYVEYIRNIEGRVGGWGACGGEGRLGGGARAPPLHSPFYIPYIFHIYIYFLNIFHICSLVCILTPWSPQKTSPHPTPPPAPPYSLYIPYIYICIYSPKYFPYIFLCFFHNLFSQQ